MMIQIAEGIYAIPETNPDLGPQFWTELPKEISDKWECVEIPAEDQRAGACNSVVLGNGKFVMDASCSVQLCSIVWRGLHAI